MSPTEFIFRKSQAFYLGLKNMSESERAKHPTPEYAQDYNGMRKMVTDAHPNVASALPPPATFRTGDGGVQECSQSWREFQGWGLQIYNLLIAAQHRQGNHPM